MSLIQRPLLTRLCRATILLAAALGFVVVLVSATPLVTWWAGKLAGPWTDPRGDVLIVLAGATEEDTLGATSYLRAHYALMAFREGNFQRVLISGGGKPVPAATSMRNFLTSQGVPGAAILVESQSGSTHENALNSKALLQQLPGKKILLTSDYHMYRARRAFARAGVEVIPRPIPDARKRASQWQGRWPAFLDLVEESFKIGYYRWRGWI